MSFKEGCYPIYKYSQDEKQQIRKELGLEDIEDDIDAIVEWFEKQPHLIDAGIPERHFIERMLLFAKGSREKTKRRIDNFYKYRALAPELVQNREEYTNSYWSFYRQATIPKLFDLKRITVIRITDPEPNNFVVDNLFRGCLLMGDLRLKYDYSLGDIWIVDLKNSSFGQLLRTNPLIAQKATQIFQDGLGAKVYAIHLLAPSYAKQVINFFRAFVKPKIIDRVIFHDKFEDLHKYIPKKYLPKDYGGEQSSLDDFKNIYLNLLKDEETKHFLAECSKQVSNESKRPANHCHEEFLDGSFKKLNLD